MPGYRKWEDVKREADRYDPQECAACMDYYRDRPHLTGACASVGIEHGMSTEQTVRAVLADYHQRGHRKREDVGCVFCDPHEAIGQTPNFWAKLDPHPVSPGHALIIARRHVESFFDLSHAAVAEAFALLTVIRDDIAEQLHPDGWNIGINDGRAAGRTIHHLHVHLIPRYLGDIEDPRGGVRNILPGPVGTRTPSDYRG